MLVSVALAQEGNPHSGSYPPGPPPIVAANYTIRARVFVDSSVIRGDWELEYQNRTNETLQELYLNLPRWKEPKSGQPKSIVCTLDSLLVNGTPSAVMVTKGDSSSVHIALEYPLKPLEKLFLLAAFTTRFSPLLMSPSALDTPSVFTAWHPSVAIFHKGKWLTGKKVRKNGWPGEFGHINVALTIDSSFELVGPGELTNEVQVYGLLPTPRHDTLVLDIMRAWQKMDPAVPPPSFASGMKTYAWRFRSARVFAFALGRNLVCDRAFQSGLAASLWYHRQYAGAPDASSTKLVSDIGEMLVAETSIQPNTQISVVVGKQRGPQVITGGLAVITVDPKTGSINRVKSLKAVLNSLQRQRE